MWTAVLSGAAHLFRKCGWRADAEIRGRDVRLLCPTLDNPGRINEAGQATQKVINRAKADLALFMNASSSAILRWRKRYRQVVPADPHGLCECTKGVQGSSAQPRSIQHTRSGSSLADIAGMEYVSVPHDDATGLVTAEHYAAMMTPDVSVATILHASPVTGMGMDIAAIFKGHPSCVAGIVSSLLMASSMPHMVSLIWNPMPSMAMRFHPTRCFPPRLWHCLDFRPNDGRHMTC